MAAPLQPGFGALTSLEVDELHPGSSWHCEAGYGTGHLVVRAAGPQGETCDKRHTLGPWPGSKGGNYPQQFRQFHQFCALRAAVPAGRSRRLRRNPIRSSAQLPGSGDSQVLAASLVEPANKFPPRRMLRWGVTPRADRSTRHEERLHRKWRTRSPMRSGSNRATSPFRTH